MNRTYLSLGWRPNEMRCAYRWPDGERCDRDGTIFATDRTAFCVYHYDFSQNELYQMEPLVNRDPGDEQDSSLHPSS